MSCDRNLRLKPAGFFTYPCRGVLHTPPNILRQGFAPKTERVFGVSVCGNMKPGGFCMYTCRGVLHTSRNVLRRRFASKTGCVFGVSLLERVKSGAFLGASGCGNMKPGGFFMYPCRGILHTPSNVLRRRFRPKTGCVFGVSV